MKKQKLKSDINLPETYFLWWLEELKRRGLVVDYKREPETFIVLPNIPVNYLKHYKTKAPLWKTFDLTRHREYTPDFVVYFDKSFINRLIGLISPETKILADYTDVFPGSGDYDNVYQETLFYTGHDPVMNDHVEVWFDVKPPAKALRFSGNLSTSHYFRFVQPLMFFNHKIFINKVVPIELFEKTFMPDRFRWTDSGKQPRLIKKEFRTLNQWMSLKKFPQQ